MTCHAPLLSVPIAVSLVKLNSYLISISRLKQEENLIYIWQESLALEIKKEYIF
jgi:hypothetical protein